MNWKSFVKSLPVIGPLALKVRRARHVAEPFNGSADYWERRYRAGGNSGAGSYNRLAEFKAEVLNGIFKSHALDSVIEFGCGDGEQLELAEYPSYIGVDVSHTVLAQVRKRFADRPTFTFLHTSEVAGRSADLGLSLDVIFHLVEDEAFEQYMRTLFAASRKIVVIYASNKNEQPDVAHVRHRRFTDWVELNRPDFRLINTIPNRFPFDETDPDHTSFADFYIYRSLNS